MKYKSYLRIQKRLKNKWCNFLLSMVDSIYAFTTNSTGSSLSDSIEIKKKKKRSYAPGTKRPGGGKTQYKLEGESRLFWLSMAEKLTISKINGLKQQLSYHTPHFLWSKIWAKFYWVILPFHTASIVISWVYLSGSWAHVKYPRRLHSAP